MTKRRLICIISLIIEIACFVFVAVTFARGRDVLLILWSTARYRATVAGVLILMGCFVAGGAYGLYRQIRYEKLQDEDNEDERVG